MDQTQKNSIQRHKLCEACDRFLNIEESLTYYTVNNNGVVDGLRHRYCKFCAKFLTKAGMEAFKAQTVGYAINPEYAEQYDYPWI